MQLDNIEITQKEQAKVKWCQDKVKEYPDKTERWQSVMTLLKKALKESRNYK